MPKFVPSEIEFAFASGGGVATSMLGDFFSRRHKVNASSDEDGLKHMPMSPVSFNPDFRWVFVFGDPVAATISLFRRDYHSLQSRKLQRGHRPFRPIPPTMTLDEYARQGEDLMGFERQFFNYYEHRLIHPTLFLRYDALWTNLEVLREFLGIGIEEMKEFPARAARKSEELIVPLETREELSRIYRPFQQRLDDLDDAFVRGENLSRGKMRLLFTENFRLAVKNGIVSRFKPVTGPYGE